MKIEQIINETTTAGAVSSVAMPLGQTQRRTTENVKGLIPAEKVLKAKKKGPYANSLSEGKEKKPVIEADLQEDDLIIIPGQSKRLKAGFIPKAQDRTDHEVEMAKADLLALYKNTKSVLMCIKDISEDEGLEGWVQEKIIKASDYMNTLAEYFEGKKIQEMSGGVIAAGGVGEGVAEGMLDRFKKKTHQPEDPSYKKGWELCNKDPSADPQFLFRKFGGGLDRNQFMKGFNDNAKSRGMKLRGDVGSNELTHGDIKYKEFKRDRGMMEDSGPQVGDEVYYGNRLVGWFKGYSKLGKIITEPNVDEMGDEYLSKDAYWDPQDKITIKSKQGVAEGYKEPTDAAGHAKMAAKIKRMLDDTLADRGDRHGNPDPHQLTRAYEYHMQKAKEKSQGVKEGVAEGAPELLKAEMPLVRHIERELADKGWQKSDDGYDKVFSSAMAMYRKFGNVDAIKKQGVAEDNEQKYRVTYDMYFTNSEKPLYTKTRTVRADSEEEAIKIIQDLIGGRNHRIEKVVAEGKFTINAKTGAKLDPRTGVELPPKEKPMTMKQMFAQPKQPKLTLDDVWLKIQSVVSNIYPDGDPIDHLAPWLKKHGIRDFKIGEILDRAAKKNGYKDLYDYWESMGDLPLSEQGVAEALDPDTQRLEQEVRDALAKGDDYTAKSLVKMAHTAADRNYLRKIIRQEMYGTGPGQGGVAEGSLEEVNTRTLVNYVPKAGRTLASLSPEERKKRSGMMTRAYQKLIPRSDFSDEIKKYHDEKNKKQGVAEVTLTEKAKSTAQQKFFGMAHAMQKGKKIPGASKELKDVAKSMSKSDVKDFAKIKHKGLPTHVKKEK